MKFSLFVPITLAGLCAVTPARSADAVWVFLADKIDEEGRRIDWPPPPKVVRSQQLDLPLDDSYLRAVESAATEIRQRSRWFNAVSVTATPEQVEDLRDLPFVINVRPVHTVGRTPDVDGLPLAFSSKSATLNYGESFEQIAAVGVHLLHARGVMGLGVRIAVIDAGFNWRDHRAFAELKVIATRDFLNGDNVVADEFDEPVTGNEFENDQNHHGTRVLGVLAGYDPGQLIGVAPEAEYILAKTEFGLIGEDGQEREPATEEDRWIAALEWADSLGAQVVNSSLAYTTFEDSTGYTYQDLDGATALTTRAAELAVARGIVVVNAAGNDGNKAWHYISVPADGAGVIAIGAVDPVNASLAYFSSRGPTADGRIKPDVVAPGQRIVTVSGGSSGSSAEPFSLQQYRRLSGTSFSTPIVSGACALLLQLHPEWTPGQVADALRSTAVDLGPAGADTLFGWGLIDLVAASGLQAIIPDNSLASAPFPNPARGSSPVIHFPVALQSTQDVSLSLFDAAGELVARTEPRHLPAGEYTVAGLAPRWDVPPHLADGIYLYVLAGTTFSRTGKVAILRTR